MAFHGDLSSYPLPELLQWLDSSRKTGALHLTWDNGERKIFLLAGQIVATASPALWERLARALEQGGITDGQRLMESLKKANREATALELTPDVGRALSELTSAEFIGALTDLTQAQSGRFHWSEDPDRGEDEWVAVELPLRHALFESLRWIDEQTDIERVLPVDQIAVKSMAPVTSAQTAMQRIVLYACSTGSTLGRLRLVLGLP